MVKIVNIHAAKTHLSRLIEEAAGGEEIVIAKAGKAVARLVPFGEKEAGKRRLGLLAGKLKIPADFDAPLPPDVLDAFEGR
jgi:prevent-host-death family protein